MRLHGFVLCLALLFAGALSAGTVYIGPASIETGAGVSWRTELVATNPTNQALHLTIVRIAEGTDGTRRAGAPPTQPVRVPARSTVVIRDAPSQGVAAMLEVTGDDALVLSGRLVNPAGGDLLGARVPIISSLNVFAGNSRYHVQGWRIDSDSYTAFGVFNLAHEPNVCAFSVVAAGGAQLLPSTQLTLPPLSHTYFSNVLDLIGVGAAADARVEIDCAQGSYAYGMVRGASSGELKLLAPSVTASSTFAPPQTSDGCPAGAACFSIPAFTPSPGNAIQVTELNGLSPNAVYDTVRVELDFRHGGWHNITDGLHGLFWLYRNQTWRSNTFGYVNLRGPNRNIVTQLANVNLPPPPAANPVRSTTGIQLSPGQRYRMVYVYDGPARTMTTTIEDASGNRLARLVDTAPTNRVPIQGGFTLQVGLHRELVEVPTFGWQYSNGRVIFQ